MNWETPEIMTLEETDGYKLVYCDKCGEMVF